jgi:hypothetical protein
MRGRLPVLLMALVALALVLSLVATLAPDASAQDSGAAPDGAAKWMRYRMPSAQDIEAAVTSGVVDGVPKNCCITTQFACFTVASTQSATTAAMPLESPRWYCPQTAR